MRYIKFLTSLTHATLVGVTCGSTFMPALYFTTLFPPYIMVELLASQSGRSDSRLLPIRYTHVAPIYGACSTDVTCTCLHQVICGGASAHMHIMPFFDRVT